MRPRTVRMHLCFMLWYDHATIHLVFFPFFLIDSCDLTEDYNDVRRGETLVMLPLPVRLLATLRAVSPSTRYFVFTSIFNLFCNAVYVFQYMFPLGIPCLQHRNFHNSLLWPKTSLCSPFCQFFSEIFTLS